VSAIVLESNMPTLKMVNRGKVRDIYDLGEHLLIVHLIVFPLLMSS